MQPKICILSDETINQIAAGEVIESPASVVKELVENALDANATSITVEIVGGGLKLVKVVDDGQGMELEDARLSIVRHATSKITNAHDLFHIMSKGFRGEALASIASIAKVEIITSIEKGWKLEVEKGVVIKERPTARVRGTTIAVHSLFYNVPARKKFQKSAAGLSAEIFRVVTLLCLAHPEVGFELINGGRSAIKVAKGQSLEERARDLLGEEFLQGAFSVEFQEGPLKFSGFIGSPTNTRTNKLGGYLFLNHRSVTCAPIAEAVREGYGTRLEEKRHPTYLLHLDAPSDLIDVNVHPQKLQVRLRKEELFREKVKEAVESALSVKGATLQVDRTPFERPQFVEAAEEMVSFSFQEEAEFELSYAKGQFLGQMGPHLLLRDDEQLVILHAKEAQFRILYEDILAKMDGKCESQGLLVPFTIQLTSVESAMVLTHLDAIEKVGFRLRPIAKDAFMVDAIPPFVNEGNVQAMIAQMGHDLQEFIGSEKVKEQRKAKLALITAQYGSRNKDYSAEEGQKLYETLLSCKDCMHSPKGNPIMVRLDHDKIEHLFTADKPLAKSPKTGRG